MNKKIIIAVVAVLVLAGAYLLRPRKSAEQPVAPGLQQRTATISRGDLSAVVSATGKVEPIQKVEVKSKGSGQIMEMPVEEGDRVQKGALIARIDETDPRNDYEQAVADLELAKATVAQAASNLRRQEELFKRGLLSQAELDVVKLEEVRAKAQLIKAQTQKETMGIRLKDSIVRSPISGIILQKNVEAGQIISSGVNSVSGDRFGMADSRSQARQLVRHGHIRVNGKRNNIPSSLVEEGDTISFTEGSKKTEYYKGLVEGIKTKAVPNWLSLDREQLTGKVLSLPTPDEAQAKFEGKTIVEFYSR